MPNIAEIINAGSGLGKKIFLKTMEFQPRTLVQSAMDHKRSISKSKLQHFLQFGRKSKWETCQTAEFINAVAGPSKI